MKIIGGIRYSVSEPRMCSFMNNNVNQGSISGEKCYSHVSENTYICEAMNLLGVRNDRHAFSYELDMQ